MLKVGMGSIPVFLYKIVVIYLFIDSISYLFIN